MQALFPVLYFPGFLLVQLFSPGPAGTSSSVSASAVVSSAAEPSGLLSFSASAVVSSAVVSFCRSLFYSCFCLCFRCSLRFRSFFLFQFFSLFFPSPALQPLLLLPFPVLLALPVCCICCIFLHATNGTPCLEIEAVTSPSGAGSSAGISASGSEASVSGSAASVSAGALSLRLCYLLRASVAASVSSSLVSSGCSLLSSTSSFGFRNFCGFFSSWSLFPYPLDFHNIFCCFFVLLLLKAFLPEQSLQVWK